MLLCPLSLSEFETHQDIKMQKLTADIRIILRSKCINPAQS
ncbi:hypothetical protein ASZ90_011601 [hydrocarbon metagenome]|uniref:Uncharacterized protein n=1 Tax=hydrocarbon metagenome TaxID=938273 RepID=A0A0W8FDH6_9ZZZZ